MQPRIRIKSELPVGKLTILAQSTRSFTVVNDLYSASFISYGGLNGERGGGGLFNFLPLKRWQEGFIRGRGAYLRGGAQ